MNRTDYLEAASDAILMRAGMLKPNAAHPHAVRLLESPHLLPQIAEYFGADAAAKKPDGTKQRAAFTAGLTSSDFKTVLCDSARSVTINQLVANSDHRAFCSIRPVPNFKPIVFPSADFDLELEEVTENGETKGTVTLDMSTGLTAKLRTYGKDIYISEVAIKNDDIGLYIGMFANAGATAARKEAAAVYGLLEANTVLADGSVMFHTDHGNVVASALDFSALGAAMAALRKQLTPAGNLADNAGAFLVVSPDLELTALNLVHVSGLKLKVIASPWLAAGRWYLTAHPDFAQFVGLLRLGVVPDGVSVGPKRDPIARVGVNLSLRVDSGVVALGRVGIIKGGV